MRTKRKRGAAGLLLLQLALLAAILAPIFCGGSRAHADPVAVKVYERKSKVWYDTKTLSTSAWWCLSLADEKPRPSGVDADRWRTEGFAVDNTDEANASCWLTEVTTAEAASLDCDDSDFDVPGGLSGPLSNPTITITKFCGRARAGTPAVKIYANY